MLGNQSRVEVEVAELKALLGSFVNFSEKAFANLREDVQTVRGDIKRLEFAVGKLENEIGKSECLPENMNELAKEISRLRVELEDAKHHLLELEQWKKEAEESRKESVGLIREKLIEYVIAGFVVLVISGTGVVLLHLIREAEEDNSQDPSIENALENPFQSEIIE